MLKLHNFPSSDGGVIEEVGVVMKSRTMCNDKSCLVHPIQH